METSGATSDTHAPNSSSSKAADKAAKSIDSLARKAHDGVDKAANIGAQAEEATREFAQRAEGASRESLDKARSRIEQNPLMAAGAAFAVGFILSALLRR